MYRKCTKTFSNIHEQKKITFCIPFQGSFWKMCFSKTRRKPIKRNSNFWKQESINTLGRSSSDIRKPVK
jgi:hypothetical protein